MVLVYYVIIGIISFSMLIGLIRGFFREVLSLITWGSGFFVANYYYSCLSVYFTRFKDELVRKGIAIVILFIATLIVGAIVNYVIGSLIKRTGLSGADRILGSCFGAFRGVLIVSILLFFLDTFTDFSQSDDWKRFQLIPQFSHIIRRLLDHLRSTSSFLPQHIELQWG